MSMGAKRAKQIFPQGWSVPAKLAAGLILASASLAAQETAAPRTIVLSLEDALRIAAGESETVWIAEAGVMRAFGNERIARSGLFPQVSGTASYTRTLRSQFQGLDFGEAAGGEDGGGFEDLPFGRENQYTLGLQLDQRVFDAGQTRARNRAAEARRRSAEIGVESAEAQALLDVTSAYFDAQLADRFIEIAQGSLEQSEEVLRQTEVARRVGDKSEYELLRARVARDNQIPTLVRRRTDRVQAYLRLKQLLNIPPENELVLTTGVSDEVPRFAEAAATAAGISPDERAPVLQAAEEIRAGEAQLTEARAQRLPNVSLSSRYAPVAYPRSGLPDPGDFQEDWTVTLNVSIPILTWGRLRGGEMVAEGTLAESRARLVQVREAAVLDARTARDELAEAQAVLAANTSTVDEAQRAFGIARIRFREGIASQIELDDARLLSEQAQVNRALALRDVQVARARLALLEDLPLSQGGLTVSQPVQPVPSTQTPSQQAITASTGGIPGLTGGPTQ
jgi:outer membrane protein